MEKRNERREFSRYDTEAKIYFHVSYGLKTKVDFQLINKEESRAKKYHGLTRNISVEGLRFSSSKELKAGDKLYLEVYIPERKTPIYMTGEVRWSKEFRDDSEKYKYDTGVKLISVMGELVHKSVYFDKEYQVFWSTVLNYIFGSFKKCIQHHVKTAKHKQA